jgi:Na+-driven multidrug efflux pump
VLLGWVLGVGAGVLTLVGVATGAERHDRMRAFVLWGAGLATALLAVPGLVVWWRPDLWLGLFTDDAAIHAVGTLYFRTIGPSYPFLGVGMVVAFAFQGRGRATLPLFVMATRVFIVLATAIVCTRVLGLGEHAVFLTIAIGNVAGTLVLATLFVQMHRRETKRGDPA